MTDLEGGINKTKCVCQTENSDLFFFFYKVSKTLFEAAIY